MFDGVTHAKEWQSETFGPFAPWPGWEVFVSGLAVGDVDKDGTNEIFVGTSEGKLYVYDGVTHNKEGEKFLAKSYGTNDLNRIIIDDIDEDAEDEIILGFNHYIYVFGPSFTGKRHPIAIALPCSQTINIRYTASFDASASYDSDGIIVDYTWDFGDDSPNVTGINPVHTYSRPGKYTVTLTVTDNDGATSTDTCIVTVLPFSQLPIADPNGPYIGYEGSAITFDGAKSYDPDGVVIRYDWDLDGDGFFETIDSGPNPAKTWGDEAIYNIGLKVMDDAYAWSEEVYTTVTVNNLAPTVEAGADQIAYEGDTVYFSGSFTDSGWLDTHIIEWNFDNGETAIGTLIPTHTYRDNGVYTVTLTITDDDGGVGKGTLTITVNNVAPMITGLTFETIEIADTYVLVTALNGEIYFIPTGLAGTFGEPQILDNLGGSIYGAAVGDFDNDGDFDALVGNPFGTWYYEKIGPGNDFAPAVSIDSTYYELRLDFAEADYNNDGNLDVIMPCFNTLIVSPNGTISGDFVFVLYLGNGDGTFTKITIDQPSGLFIGIDSADFNNDGNTDFIAVPIFWPEGAFIYLGNGDGTFQEPIVVGYGWSIGVVAGDFDNDGNDDFISGISPESPGPAIVFPPPIYFYPGNGDGTFGTPLQIDIRAQRIAKSDFNGDSNLDVVYIGGFGSNEVGYAIGNGDGTFSVELSIYLGSGLFGIAATPTVERRVYVGDVVSFTGTFIDPGWLDTHSATWNWGDGSLTEPGTLIEDNNPLYATGLTMGEHIFMYPGTYNITLTVRDDDDGVNTRTITVHVTTAEEAKHIISNYIQNLPDDAFDRNPQQRKNALANKFDAVDRQLDVGAYQGAINKLLNDIRSKMDGTGQDWITDPTAQQELCAMIDALIAYLETLL